MLLLMEFWIHLYSKVSVMYLDSHDLISYVYVYGFHTGSQTYNALKSMPANTNMEICTES